MLFSAKVTAMATDTAADPLAAIDAETEAMSAVIKDVSDAETSTSPPVITVLPFRIDASTVLVVVLVALAPLPAPESEKDPLPDTDTPIAAAKASMVLSAVADTVINPPASTVESSMVAKVVPPMLFSANVTAMATDTAADPLADTEADADTTSAVIEELSSAITVTAPNGTSTSLPEISAEIVLVVVLLALAPLPAPESEKDPLPPILAEAATATVSMVLMPSAETSIEPDRLSTSAFRINADVSPLIMFSASVTEMPRVKATELDAPMDTLAETTSEVMADVSVASTEMLP
jgi:hypothetical protein